jgi:hypothetical protein
MKIILHILTLGILSTAIFSCGPATPEAQRDDDIIIVDGDTLGRNWDNLPTAEEAEAAKALGLTPEQYLELKAQEEQQMLIESQRQDAEDNDAEESDILYGPANTTFSDKMYREERLTIESIDGRELVIDSSMGY